MAIEPAGRLNDKSINEYGYNAISLFYQDNGISIPNINDYNEKEQKPTNSIPVETKQIVPLESISSLIINPEPRKNEQAKIGPDYTLELNNRNSHFINLMVDPYKAFEMLAKNLDKAGYKIQNHKPLKDERFNSFEEYAKHINNKIKEYVKAVANLPRIKSLREGYTNVLFAETAEKLDISDHGTLTLYYFQQPTLFPILYAKPDSETPGFGLFFPKPNSHNADKWFDNWFGIGAAENNDPQAGNSWRTSLYEGYKNTAHYVFYNYNSNNLAKNTNKENFEKFFKETIKNEKVIPIDFQFDYASIWGPVGTLHFVESFAKHLGVTQEDLDSIKDKKPKIPQTQEYLRAPNQPDKKLAVMYYNLWDHMIMLGIQPDYSDKNSQEGPYQKVAGVFESYIKDINKTDFETLNRYNLSEEAIHNANLYAYATNESHWRMFNSRLVNDHRNADESKPKVKSILTGRGDNDLTRSPFEFHFYDYKDHTLHKVVGKPSDKGKGKKFIEFGDQPSWN
ncbi:ABC transporter, substrate binding protein [Ureaplasma diversum NCTC 246]|uniref:ABC transporter, substrate binding protein n=2 Tax=Ureaplasma diversum TaxID=42094 RepID=A0A084F0R2_9BACT|nr:ABC transporter, substrate binding protein [Ureaplasma diversum NCTC 246]